jgi:ribonuclease HI
MQETITLEFDGGSRGNPGPAGIGVVLRAADSTPLVTIGQFLGRATNNAAEYSALILGLRKARELGARQLMVRGDSELVIRQMKGEYRIRHPDLKPLYEQAQTLVREFTSVRLEHCPRGRNALADKLANLAMDRRGEVTDVDEPTAPAAAPPAAYSLRCGNCGCRIKVLEPSPDAKSPFVCPCGGAMR